jgi:UDP-2,3-diacylglucosamine hydrolase
MLKKTYFLSDVHLGSKAHANSIEVERKLCRWLDMVRQDAHAIYLLGDIFDYWYEYKHVVPKGFVRLLGKLAEITDSGVEVHFFVGNHDFWLTDYLAKECGLTLHFAPKTVEIGDKKIFLAHGDGLGVRSKSSRFLRTMFHCRFLRACFSAVHPRWTVPLAHAWSNHSRKHDKAGDFLGEDKEELVIFAKKKLEEVPDIDYFIFGHRHILLDLPIAETSRVIIVGDWTNYFSYGVLDAAGMRLERIVND